MDRSSDGFYARSNIFEWRSDQHDPIGPELREVVEQFRDYTGMAANLAKIAVEMDEYELDPRSPEGQRLAARVLRTRLTKRPNWLDGTVKAERERTAVQRGSVGTNVVYYVDLYGAAIKIGTSQNVIKRLVGLRRRSHHLLALEPGSLRLEQQRHAEFDAFRLDHPEDFSRSKKLLEHIEKVRAEHGEPLEFLRSQANPAA